MPQTISRPSVSQRRSLRFTSFKEVIADLDRLEEAHSAGSLRPVGGWSAGQNFVHLAKTIDYSIDGFPFTLPLPMRLIGRILKKQMLGGKPFSSGFKLRGKAAVMAPPASASFEDGIAHLRRSIARVSAGERMSRRSPVFGAMSHEEWTTLHLKHCDLHLSHLALE